MGFWGNASVVLISIELDEVGDDEVSIASDVVQDGYVGDEVAHVVLDADVANGVLVTELKSSTVLLNHALGHGSGVSEVQGAPERNKLERGGIDFEMARVQSEDVDH